MDIDIDIAWSAFTPWASLAGGGLIGLAVAIYLLGSGRVAGISGVVGDAISTALDADRGERDIARWAFLAGLVIAPWLWWLFAPLPDATHDVSAMMLVGGGLLVGIGARLGSGCTSGHGVCGLARFSPRSLLSVIVFMGVAGLVVYAMRHLVIE